MWDVVFYMPGENEVPLLADCRQRPDVRLLGVVDPDGTAPGTSLAEVMGLTVHATFATAAPPAGAHVVTPGNRRSDADLHRAVQAHELRALGAGEMELILAEGVTTPATDSEPPPVQPPPPTVDETVDAGGDEQGEHPVSGSAAAAHRTLDRIEDVMDRDKLLPWLLSLAMAAVEGSSGSLMLYDSRADDLYIAAAKGLSPSTLHSTRQPLGHGVSGRVADSRRPKLVQEMRSGGSRRDDDGIVSALSVPLVHGGELLGVLNVNVSEGQRPFDASHLAELDNLAEHVARILHGSAGAWHVRTGAVRKRLGREFRDLSDDGSDLETVLVGWSAALALELGAAQAALALVREDGSLLLAEGTSAGETRVGGIPQRHPAWNDVLQSARPLLARQENLPGENDDDGLSLFFLPLGREPVHAVLAVSFDAPSDAHRFQSRTDSVVDLLEAHLPELLRRYEEQDHVERLRALTSFMGRFAAGECDGNREEIKNALRLLTGARRILFTDEADSGVDVPAAARDLLNKAEDRGWIVATVDPGSDDDGDLTCLAVRPPDARGKGVVLLGKDRLHCADSSAFTDFDAVLARHLAPLAYPGSSRSPGHPPRRLEPGPSRTATPVPEDLHFVLSREMDRADRYHVAFSLSVFSSDTSDESCTAHVQRLRAKLRTSDQIFTDRDGLLFVIAPEEIHAVAHLEHRAVDALREAAGDPDLVVRTGRALYPGRDTSPETLIASAKQALSVRSRDGD